MGFGIVFCIARGLQPRCAFSNTHSNARRRPPHRAPVLFGVPRRPSARPRRARRMGGRLRRVNRAGGRFIVPQRGPADGSAPAGSSIGGGGEGMWFCRPARAPQVGVLASVGARSTPSRSHRSHGRVFRHGIPNLPRFGLRVTLRLIPSGPKQIDPILRLARPMRLGYRVCIGFRRLALARHRTCVEPMTTKFVTFSRAQTETRWPSICCSPGPLGGMHRGVVGMVLSQGSYA